MSAFATPEEAALADFDPGYARVVETLYHGPDLAEVQLATNEEPNLYPYFVRCHRGPDGWTEGASANAPMSPW